MMMSEDRPGEIHAGGGVKASEEANGSWTVRKRRMEHGNVHHRCCLRSAHCLEVEHQLHPGYASRHQTRRLE
jgi:hypothetical protein